MGLLGIPVLPALVVGREKFFNALQGGIIKTKLKPRKSLGQRPPEKDPPPTAPPAHKDPASKAHPTCGGGGASSPTPPHARTHAPIFPAVSASSVGVAILDFGSLTPSRQTPRQPSFTRSLHCNPCAQNTAFLRNGKNSVFRTATKEAAILYVKPLHFRTGQLT